MTTIFWLYIHTIILERGRQNTLFYAMLIFWNGQGSVARARLDILKVPGLHPVANSNVKAFFLKQYFLIRYLFYTLEAWTIYVYLTSFPLFLFIYMQRFDMYSDYRYILLVRLRTSQIWSRWTRLRPSVMFYYLNILLQNKYFVIKIYCNKNIFITQFVHI